jgi:hypothetical protein
MNAMSESSDIKYNNLKANWEPNELGGECKTCLKKFNIV